MILNNKHFFESVSTRSAISYKGLVISTLVLAFFIFSTVSAQTQTTWYGDVNRQLFITPQSAALASADAGTTRNATPNSNPSLIATDSVSNFTLAYANYFQNSFSSSVFSFVTPLTSNSGWGFALCYLLIPDIEIHQFSEPDSAVIEDQLSPIVKTSSDVVFRTLYGQSYSISKKFDLAWGVAINTERKRLIDWSGYGIGIDGGISGFYKKKVAVSLLFENIKNAYVYWSESSREQYLPHIRLSVGYQKSLEYLYGKLVFSYTSPDLLSNDGVNASEAAQNFSDDQIPVYKKVSDDLSLLLSNGKFGAEYLLLKRLALRAGINDRMLNFGAGIKMFNERALIDFAYSTHELAGTYQLSLSYQW